MSIISSLLSLFTTFNGGPRLISGDELRQFANLTLSVTYPITAKAGGGQAGATILPSFINTVTVCATNDDSVMLPLALPGTTVVVYNGTVNTLALFGQPVNPNTGQGDRIVPHNSNAAAATATGIEQTTTLTAIYYCFAPGLWKQLLSA